MRTSGFLRFFCDAPETLTAADVDSIRTATGADGLTVDTLRAARRFYASPAREKIAEALTLYAESLRGAPIPDRIDIYRAEVAPLIVALDSIRDNIAAVYGAEASDL